MSRRRSRRAIAAVVTSSLLVCLGVAGSSVAATPDTTVETSVATMPGSAAETSVPSAMETAIVEILPPDETWGGLSRGELEARGWQRFVSLPEDVNPYFDTTGERCGYAQSGPVFFLPPNFDAVPDFTCVVAEGTAIYVHLAGNECSSVEPPPYFGQTEDELRECAAAGTDGWTVEARVNGREMSNLDAYRTTSPLFTMTFPENNVAGLEPGVAQSVAWGIGFIIAPPPPGEYEVFTSSMRPGSAVPNESTVTVVVEAPQVIEPPTT